MKLLFHIFRKDTRHLYPEILLTLALTIIFAWVAPVQWGYGRSTAVFDSGGATLFLLNPFTRLLLPLVWMILITRLVHDESLVGDRQFWITRPYTWPTLLAAKLLFLAVFLYLPFFLMQCYLLHHASLDVMAALPDLFRYHLRLTAIYFLPVLAIATVTATFARQFISILAGFAYIGVILALESHWMNHRVAPPGFATALLAVSSLILICVVLLQYVGRRTLLSRILLIALPLFLLAAFLSAPAKMLIQRTYPESQSKAYTFGLDSSSLQRDPSSARPLIVENNIILSLPVQLHGLSAGVWLKGMGVEIEIDTPQGFHWSSHYQEIGADFNADNPEQKVEVFVPLAVFNRIRDTAVDLRMNIVFVKYQSEAAQSFTVGDSGFRSPGAGNCPLRPDGLAASCLYPLRLPASIDISAQVSDQPCLGPTNMANSVAYSFVGSDQNYVAFDFDPVTTSQMNLSRDRKGPPHALYICPGSAVTLTPHTSGRERLSFRQQGIVLAPYARHLMEKGTAPAIVVPINPQP